MIQRILVANRGEIARRVFRTCREMGIDTVAVFSDPDAGEPHAIEADDAVHLPGFAATDTYLNIPAVVKAASESEADAIHPGYGFLAENAEFAEAVTEAGLTWIGPSPHAIRVMGSKVASKQLMGDSGIATLSSFEVDGLSVPQTAGAALGFPLLVKASAGGGGKGMRIVNDPDALPDALEAAKREAAGAFGDDTVFIERYLTAPRHVEIQVLADTQGRTVSLFERECSIQRRYQKIVEESPSIAVDDDLRKAMGEAAVAAARAVDYVGAGTVEFLLQDGEFFFLEMNTRLQVEHPVTEAITGLDLVRLQIEIAAGRPMSAEAAKPRMKGHAIEARLYAEDPLNDFLPATGAFHRFTFVESAGIRVDSGIEDGSEVSVFYDPMLAKVIAHAATRDEAIALLAASLRSARIHGSATNRALLVRILESEQFTTGETDTHFLDRHDLGELARPLADRKVESQAARAAALADQAHERASARVLGTIPSGFRNMPGSLQHRVYTGSDSEHHVSYAIDRDVASFGDDDSAELVTVTPNRVEFSLHGVGHEFEVARYGDIRHVDSPMVPVRLVEVPRFPDISSEDDSGSLLSPMPGRIVRVDAMVDDLVKEGQVLVVLEAMKMEHSIRAPHAGRVVSVDCAAGDQVEGQAVLVVVDGADTA